MNRKDRFIGGWFECQGTCQEKILIEGVEFYEALFKDKIRKVYCDKCDPENGFEPVRRSSEIEILKLEE